MRLTFVKMVMIAIVATAVVHEAKFKSTWKAPDAGPLDYAGKKIAAVVVTDDQGLEMSAEEALARELTVRGVQGVAAYRLIPREELRDKDKAKGWFERSNIAGAVVMRVVSAEREVTYTPATWATTSYSSLWGYYGYGWSAVYIPGGRSERSSVTIETLIFDVPTNKLLWAGVSETTNPKGTQKVVWELVNEVAAEMRKVGLVPKGK